MAGISVLVAQVPGQARAAAHALLTRAAAGELSVPPGELAVTHEPDGRPLLAGTPVPLHVSVSHAGDRLVGVALSRHCPVGVDVEVPRARLPGAALARRWLAPAEADWVAGLPASEQPAGFCRLWVQKEAVGKALGTGLRGGGTRRPVALPGRRPGEGGGSGPVRYADRTPLVPLPGRPDLACAAVRLPPGRAGAPAAWLAVAAWTGAARTGAPWTGAAAGLSVSVRYLDRAAPAAATG